MSTGTRFLLRAEPAPVAAAWPAVRRFWMSACPCVPPRIPSTCGQLGEVLPCSWREHRHTSERSPQRRKGWGRPVSLRNRDNFQRPILARALRRRLATSCAWVGKRGFRARLDWDQVLMSPRRGVNWGTPLHLSGPPFPHRHQRSVSTSYCDRASQTRLHSGAPPLGLFKKQPGPGVPIFQGWGAAGPGEF